MHINLVAMLSYYLAWEITKDDQRASACVEPLAFGVAQ